MVQSWTTYQPFIVYQGSWASVVRTLWQINPAIAVYSAERLKNATIRLEVGKLVRSSTLDVLDNPEALAFLSGDRLDPSIQRDLKVWRLTSLFFRSLIQDSSTFFFGHLSHLSLHARSFNRGITATHSFCNTPIESWNNIQLSSHSFSCPKLSRHFVTTTLVSISLDRFFCGAVESFRLCRTLHFGDGEDFPAFLPSNYLEYGSKLL
jgi:hypothetical protein